MPVPSAAVIQSSAVAPGPAGSRSTRVKAICVASGDQVGSVSNAPDVSVVGAPPCGATVAIAALDRSAVTSE
ncbi:hypothetical protein BH23ACT7_BH23ACT7_22410 [soil metagenome]